MNSDTEHSYNYIELMELFIVIVRFGKLLLSLASFTLVHGFNSIYIFSGDDSFEIDYHASFLLFANRLRIFGCSHRAFIMRCSNSRKDMELTLLPSIHH